MLERVRFALQQVRRPAGRQGSRAGHRRRSPPTTPTQPPLLFQPTGALQGVPAEQVLVLTFSRRAQGEFAERLRQRVPGAEAATVSTFHAWSWHLMRRHWREAGYDRPPAVAAGEDQLLAVMRDCLT